MSKRTKKAKTKRRNCGASKPRSQLYVIRVGKKVLATACKSEAQKKVKACRKRLSTKKARRGDVCDIRVVRPGRFKMVSKRKRGKRK